MKHNYFLLNSNRTQLGDKSVWTVPIDNKQFKPNMRVKLVGATATLTNTNEYKTIGVKLLNRSHNSTSSDNTSNSLLGFLHLMDVAGNVAMKLSPIDITAIIKSNPTEWSFGLFDEADSSVAYADVTDLNLVLEVEYIDNEKERDVTLKLL